MDKVQMGLLGVAVVVFLVIVLLVGALGVVGYLYLKSTPNTGGYNYSSYNVSANVSVTPGASPTPSPTATASPTATPSPTPTPEPSNCATYEGKTEEGSRVCGGKDADSTKKYVWECVDGTWTYKETCSSASACDDGVCS